MLVVVRCEEFKSSNQSFSLKLIHFLSAILLNVRNLAFMFELSDLYCDFLFKWNHHAANYLFFPLHEATRVFAATKKE